MKPQLADKIKDALSNKYLDLAESLPKTSRGPIHELQQLREEHREDSEKAYEKSRPPTGIELDFLYFRLVEMFQLEDFERLGDGIVRLIPGLKDDVLSLGFSARFERHAESMHGGSWLRLGYILRDRKQRWIGMDPYRIMPELPEEVHYLELEVHKLLPSIFVVTIDVHLTEEATQHIVRLQDRQYLPRLKLKKPVPWKIWRHGFSHTAADMEMRNAIIDWLDELRGHVEHCLEPFISGHFMLSSSDKTAHLPAIEIYGLKGAPEGIEPFYNWTKETRRWLDSLGFDFFSNTYYDKDGLIFIWPEDESLYGFPSHRGQPAFRLMVLWEPYLRSIDTSMHGGDEKTAVFYYTQDVLTAMLSTVALIQFLNSIQGSIEKIRKVTYTMMISGRRLGRYLKLNSTIQRESMLLERISVDIKQQKELLERKMEGLESFELIIGTNSTKERSNLKGITNEIIEGMTDLLRNQLSLVSKSSTEFLALQNMRAMYRLQWYVLALAIVATIATIVSAVASWPAILEFLRVIGLNRN